MKNKIQPGKKQKQKIRQRLLIVLVIFSLFMITAGSLLVIMNLNNLSKMRAAGTNEQGGGNVSNGEIICEFNWDNGDAKTATLGPDAIATGKMTHTMTGGTASTNGLSPGGKDINLVIAPAEIFNLDGIDISIDFRRSEPSGSFFTKENSFNFGMENGFVTIKYCTESKTGKLVCVKENTDFEIPADPQFRTYRFIYTPTTGKAEIFVNNIVVWQHQGEKESPLRWKNSSDIIIGKDMDGGGQDRCIFDNLVIRNTESVPPLAESLLNFMLEAREGGGVKIHWSTSANQKVSYFTIERSENGIHFENVARVNANADEQSNEYIYTDLAPAGNNVVYYRLRQTFLNGKFSTHALSAIRFKSDKGFSIERINPTPFEKNCDISYYLPKPGRVWMQVTNEKGDVVTTSTFEAQKGKNIHVFRDDKKLVPGTYTFSLIFEGKKASAKIVKS